MFFFPGSQNQYLLGFLHYSDKVPASTGIIYCHPFAEEKNMSHSVIAGASRQFASAGFPVMRFDFSGCGDSEGDLQSVVIEDWLDDLDAAVKIFRKETGVPRFLFWGLRMGAGLALLNTELGKHDLCGLILWQPVVDFTVHIAQFMRNLISSEISRGIKSDTVTDPYKGLFRDGLVYVMGYPVSLRLYDSFRKIGSKPAKIIPPAPMLVLSVSVMEQPAFTIRKYVRRIEEAGISVDMRHLISEPFWDRYWQWECKKAADITLQWLHNFR